jgi:hypothetical protein
MQKTQNFTFPFFSGQSSIKRDGDGAEKDSEREKAIVLLQEIAILFLSYISVRSEPQQTLLFNRTSRSLYASAFI